MMKISPDRCNFGGGGNDIVFGKYVFEYRCEPGSEEKVVYFECTEPMRKV
jgi:hypothetical protein